MTTLHILSTGDNWAHIFYISYYGCDVYPDDHYTNTTCLKPREGGILAVIVFVTYICLSNWVLMNLFVGVVTSSIEEAKEELTAEQEYRNKNTKLTVDVEIFQKLTTLQKLMGRITREANLISAQSKNYMAKKKARLGISDGN